MFMLRFPILSCQQVAIYPGHFWSLYWGELEGVFFDYGNLQSIEQELYAWGEKKVIFNDLYEMVESIMKFKYNPLSNPDLGDWSTHLSEIDPFRDERGGERIGTYIRWLQKGFEEGLERDASIAQASQKYADAWGEDKIYYSGSVKKNQDYYRPL